MDSITQAALGAALAGAVAGKTLGRSALLTGALLATVPDLDVLIDYGTAVANYTQHRGFSHSLFVLTPLAVLLAWLFWRWKPQMDFRRWLALTCLVLLTHPLLDSFTTYGTQLFWPLGGPLSVNSIFIVDPLYTLPLLAGCLVFLIRPPAQRALMVGLALSTAYLAWSVVAQQVITQRALPLLADTNLKNAQLLVQPMPFNTLRWRVTAIQDDQRLEATIGFFEARTPLDLQYFPRRMELADAIKNLPEAQQFELFTKGFLDYRQDGDQITATDIRLGVPGGHPFTFVLATVRDGVVHPVPSFRSTAEAPSL